MQKWTEIGPIGSYGELSWVKPSQAPASGACGAFAWYLISPEKADAAWRLHRMQIWKTHAAGLMDMSACCSCVRAGIQADENQDRWPWCWPGRWLPSYMHTQLLLGNCWVSRKQTFPQPALCSPASPSPVLGFPHGFGPGGEVMGKQFFFSLQFLAGQPSWNLHVLNRLFGDVAFGTRTAESQPIQLASGCFHDRKACDDCYTIHTNIYRQKSTDTTPALSPKPTPLSIQESFECRDNIKTVFGAL